MKNTLQLLSIAAGLALALPVQAGSHHFGGNSGGGASAASAPSQASHSAPSRSYSGRNFAGRNFAARNFQGRTFAGRSASTAGPRMVNGRLNSAGSRIIARQSANAHPNWARNHDHFWNGHRCRFIGGSWVVFDLGFYDPFFGGYPYGYPYAYGYPYGYPYGGYETDEPDNNGVYEGRNPGYQGSDANSSGESPVAVAQARLKRLGYYHGRVDGEFGPETSRAISAYQRDHGMRVTGSVTRNSLGSIQGRE